ncbi:hypothetical protein EUGRSUZ_B01951 [Eucalyptus grandis]|uniref:Uncharacterized protein n=2 Tax=Eucalyptus grandis TaxID=71139 RepID=A0ACC3LRD1_EUCGR|nr:hypothetical protein EUGRSUZ_B01951 [Eucalyptus grandis]
MGLLHLMRIRFRHPIPDIFAPKICSDNDQGRQVDSGRDAHLETPVWISSTIPGSWRWQPLGSLDASSGDVAKRQSTCELETWLNVRYPMFWRESWPTREEKCRCLI